MLTKRVNEVQTLSHALPAPQARETLPAVKTQLLTMALILALPLPVLAEVIPKPRLRPAEASTTVIPVPKLRPAPSSPADSSPESPPAGEEAGWSAEEVSEAKASCAQLLKGLAIDYEPLAPIGRSGGCGAPAPVLVSQVDGVTLTPPATLTCKMAAALYAWVSDSVKPEARQRLKTEVTAIKTASSYVCRRRNNSSSGKMSEHSRANALDMAGFTFAEKGKGVAVGGGNWGQGMLAALGVSRDGSFLEAIRRDACTHFTTVLGPGSDPYHGDHFHVDVLARKGDYRICQ